jgi:hypothetical protein
VYVDGMANCVHTESQFVVVGGKPRPRLKNKCFVSCRQLCPAPVSRIVDLALANVLCSAVDKSEKRRKEGEEGEKQQVFGERREEQEL